jgi:pyruvate,orthophosphate dikinase
MKWSDKHRTLKVRTNADTPEDAQRARDFGAEGIGLCRTEHMFFEGDRIEAMRDDPRRTPPESRVKALAKLLPYQRDDFIGIFKAMKGLPVTIRLLDPPLHEFLPHDDKRAEGNGARSWALARRRCKSARQRSCTRPTRCSATAAAACAITYPEILEMQVRAIVEAAIECTQASDRRPCPRSCIPLAGTQEGTRAPAAR